MDDLIQIVDLLDWAAKPFSKQGRRELKGCFLAAVFVICAICAIWFVFAP